MAMISSSSVVLMPIEEGPVATRGRGRSPGIAHACCNSVHREKQGARDLRITCALAAYELDLNEVQRVDVRVAQLDGAGERRVSLEKAAALRQALDPAFGEGVLGADRGPDVLSHVRSR